MKVYVNVKQIGKKKQFIEKKEYEISSQIVKVEDLIREFVKICVSDFNSGEVLPYLSADEIKANSQVGKIGFGDRENKNLQDEDKAIANALQSYEDGIFKIFLNEEEMGELHDGLHIKEGDQITFIRLVMLAGRMW